MIPFYNMMLLSFFFLLVFAIGEIAFRFGHINAEITRKWSHIGSGLLSLLFPVYFNSLWWVGVICGLFLLILLLSKSLNLLPSINSVSRQTYGSILFPVAVFVSFNAYIENDNDLLYYYLPILTLSVCDLCAGLVGQRFPIRKIRIYKDSKSLGGFCAFVVSSFLLNSILIYAGLPVTPLVFLLIPFVAAAIELLSPKGIDNITIPVAVIVLLLIFNV